MKTLSSHWDNGAVASPIWSNLMVTAAIRIVIGAVLLGVMVLAGIALGYASAVDMQV